MTRSVHTIACPQCRYAQSVELVDVVDVQAAPELREALLANRLNSVACAACGFRFRIDPPLLYRDPARGFVIWLQPAPDAQADAAERAFHAAADRWLRYDPAGAPRPAAHLVLDRVGLVERIFLLEAGLDERIVEYVKHSIYTKNLARLDPAKKRLLFNAQDSDAEHLVFVVQDVESRRLENAIQYRREAYTALCEMFDADAQTAHLLALFPGPYISARRLLLATDEEPDAK